MNRPNSINGVRLGRDHFIVLLLLAAVTALAWFYTIHQAHLMDAMEAAMRRDMNMPMNGMAPSWTPVDALLSFVMWAAMMAAMMVPGAGPMIAAFATINRRRRQRGAPYVATTVFLLGYLLVWTGFSLLATALQWALQKTGLLTTMMQSASWWLTAALFLAAGLYQFSPLKQRCLEYCRSTDGFILSEWRDGELGAIVMGLRHGLFCTLCCAGLMLLVTAEKLLPHPTFWRVGIGATLIAIGAGCAIAGL